MFLGMLVMCKMKRKNKPFLEKIYLLLLGLILGLIVLELILQAASGIIYLIQRGNTFFKYNEPTYKILALGDSTTAQQIGAESWPKELEKILNTKRKDLKFVIYNEGIPGTTTALVLSRLPNYLSYYQPDMVITMIGINDFSEYMFRYNIIKSKLKTPKLVYWLIETYKNKKYNYLRGYYVSEACESNYTLSSFVFYRKLDEITSKKVREWCQFVNLGDLYLSNASNYDNIDVTKNIEFLNKAIHSYEISLSYNPNIADIRRKLGSAYIELAEIENNSTLFEKAIYNLNMAIETDPSPIYYDMNIHYLMRGYAYFNITTKEKARIFFREEMKGFDIFSNAKGYESSKLHYQEMYNLINSKNIKMVVMQYPTLSINQLKDYFTETKDRKNLFFVSNEHNFNSALLNTSYDTLFYDFVGRTFGHTTTYGSRLIAENLADNLSYELDINS